jgi:hypothetical protein
VGNGVDVMCGPIPDGIRGGQLDLDPSFFGEVLCPKILPRLFALGHLLLTLSA